MFLQTLISTFIVVAISGIADSENSNPTPELQPQPQQPSLQPAFNVNHTPMMQPNQPMQPSRRQSQYDIDRYVQCIVDNPQNRGQCWAMICNLYEKLPMCAKGQTIGQTRRRSSQTSPDTMEYLECIKGSPHQVCMNNFCTKNLDYPGCPNNPMDVMTTRRSLMYQPEEKIMENLNKPSTHFDATKPTENAPPMPSRRQSDIELLRYYKCLKDNPRNTAPCWRMMCDLWPNFPDCVKPSRR